MKPAKLKGYSEQQRKYAAQLRKTILHSVDFNCSPEQEERLKQRLCEITSPMFFIRYKHRLVKGDIASCLSEFEELKYRRRASFIQNK